MGRRDFVSSKKKSAFLGMTKASSKGVLGQLKKADRMGRGFVDDQGGGEPSAGGGLLPSGSDLAELLESIVFKDELRDYVTSVINNVEPNEYVWDDLQVPVTTVKAGGAAPTFDTFTDGLKTWLFPTGADAEVHFASQIPHTWMEGTDLHPHVHWAPMNTDTGNVAWCLEYSWQDVDGTFPSSTTITPTADVADGTALKHQYHDMGDITGTGKKISSIIVCRLYRDVSEDNYNSNAALLGFDFHIRVDARGSGTELAK